MPKFLPVIVGPTASGKTAMGIKMAEVMDGEIVSADSRQVYIGMEIGNGAPTKAELAQVPHHLISFVLPDQRLSSGEFARHAHNKIEEIFRKGKIPIVVGGSGLYIKALIEGLSPIPQPDLKLRSRISEEVESRGMTKMIKELKSIDPEYAVRIDLNNKKRLIRALEVYRQTGRTFSDWHKSKISPPPFEPILIGLDMPRSMLHNLIAQRVLDMISNGWKQEVEKLAEQYGGIERLPVTVAEGIGYKEIVKLIREKIDLNTAVELITIRTRQFARRQLTWFHGIGRIHWIMLSDNFMLEQATQEALQLCSMKIPSLIT